MLRKMIVSFALTLAAWIAFAPAVYGLADPVEAQPPENYECAAVLLMEPESGQIIFAKNEDARRQVASVTKIMTILLTVEAIENGQITLEESVSVSENAAAMGGSQALLDAGERQTVEALLRSTIVGSANDSAVALAEHISGSVSLFVDRMNQRARELGMEDTCFINATGLPGDGQYTTAADVAKMAAELSKHELFYQYSTLWLEEFVHESGRVTQLTNTNKMVRLYDGCDGLKTGSTNEAGYCMAATAKRGNLRLIAVVLGADTGSRRFEIASAMLDHGFAAYRLYPVAEEGARVRGEMVVAGGGKKSIPLYLGGDLTLLLKKGEEQKITLSPQLPDCVTAPVKKGDIVGCVEVYMDETPVGRVNVIAGETVERLAFGGALGRMLGEWPLGG